MLPAIFRCEELVRDDINIFQPLYFLNILNILPSKIKSAVFEKKNCLHICLGAKNAHKPHFELKITSLCRTRQLSDYHRPVEMALNPEVHPHQFHQHPYPFRMVTLAQPMMGYTIPILGTSQSELVMFHMLKWLKRIQGKK